MILPAALLGVAGCAAPAPRVEFPDGPVASMTFPAEYDGDFVSGNEGRTIGPMTAFHTAGIPYASASIRRDEHANLFVTCAPTGTAYDLQMNRSHPVPDLETRSEVEVRGVTWVYEIHEAGFFATTPAGRDRVRVYSTEGVWTDAAVLRVLEGVEWRSS